MQNKNTGHGCRTTQGEMLLETKWTRLPMVPEIMCREAPPPSFPSKTNFIMFLNKWEINKLCFLGIRVKNPKDCQILTVNKPVFT